MNFSETSGKTDKLLTRASERVLDQQIQHEGDMITPWTVDKSTNKVEVNQDFIDKYPEQAAGIFSEQELKQSGNDTLKPQDHSDDEGVTHSGDQEQAIKEMINE